MAVTATYAVKVDWDNDGDYGDSHEDVTGHLLDIPKIDRGRDKAWELGKGRAAIAEIVLDNESKLYSPEYSGGDLYGNLKPNRPVQISATYGSTYNLFTGYLQSITCETTVGKKRATLYCEDGMCRLRNVKVNVKTYESIATGTALGHILDAAGWPAGARSLDTGQTTMLYWWVWDKTALEAIREIEETELGLCYIDEDGNFVFEDRHHKLKGAHLTSQETYGTSDRVYSDFRYDRRVKDVYNIAEVTINTYTEGSQATLWTLDETPMIAPGETRTFRAIFTNGAVDLVDPLVASTDYTANSQSGGGGTDLTSDMSVTLTDLGQGADIEVENTGSEIAYLTLLQVRGKLLTTSTKTVSAENTTSQGDYDERSYPLPGAHIPTENIGKDYCDFVVQKYGEEVPVVKFRIYNHAADDLTEILTRKVSDRITVENDELGLDEEFFVHSITHYITNQCRLHMMEIEAELASGETYWVLGTSQLGVDTRLCY